MMNSSMFQSTKSMLTEQGIEHTDAEIEEFVDGFDQYLRQNALKEALSKASQPKPMTTARKFGFKELIVDKLSEALELAEKCANELQDEFDTLPAHSDGNGEWEYDNSDRAEMVEKQLQQALSIDEGIKKLLVDKDDWFIVGWSYQFHFPNPAAVKREMQSIEAEIE